MATTQLINPSNFLEASSVTLVTLLTSSNFIVPDYQRDYSWTTDEVQNLWDDLSSTATKSFNTAGSLVVNPAPHFLGPIVLQSFPPAQNKTPEIIDGQQRLVTLTSLISVLCEFANELVQQSDRDIWINSLKHLLFTYISGNKVSRLCLAREDLHYQEMVCNRFIQANRRTYANPPGPTASALIKKAYANSVLGKLYASTTLLYDSVNGYLGPVSTSGRDMKLVQLFKTVLELTVVLQMKVLEQGVAYEVFETLNARGLDLQQADLLKNKLYSLAEQQGTKNEVAVAWGRTIKAIEQQSLISLTEFFHFHLVAKYKESKQSDLYKEVLLHLNTGGNSAKLYAEDIAKSAEAIQQIVESGSSFSHAVVRDVESIRDLITNKYAITLLIAGAAKYAITSSEMARLIKLTHHYVFRRFVVEGLAVGTYAAEISSIAREFSSGQIPDVDALAMHLASKSNQLVFEAKLKQFSAATSKVGFYVMEMIENHVTANAGTYVQRQSVSQHLEHILPKRTNPTDWGHVHGDPELPDYVNRIGNFLVLEADKNSYIKNKAFLFKNSNLVAMDYQHSSLTLPQSVVNFLDNGRWTYKSIKDRQDSLVSQYAGSVWSLA